MKRQQPLPDRFSGICLVAGDGVGVVTKPGLPVVIGEPAVNPAPRMMLAQNVTEELLRIGNGWGISGRQAQNPWVAPREPHVFLSFTEAAVSLDGTLLVVEVSVPGGVRTGSTYAESALGNRRRDLYPGDDRARQTILARGL